jgi:hypothetical protein
MSSDIVQRRKRSRGSYGRRAHLSTVPNLNKKASLENLKSARLEASISDLLISGKTIEIYLFQTFMTLSFIETGSCTSKLDTSSVISSGHDKFSGKSNFTGAV